MRWSSMTSPRPVRSSSAKPTSLPRASRSTTPRWLTPSAVRRASSARPVSSRTAPLRPASPTPAITSPAASSSTPARSPSPRPRPSAAASSSTAAPSCSVRPIRSPAASSSTALVQSSRTPRTASDRVARLLSAPARRAPSPLMAPMRPFRVSPPRFPLVRRSSLTARPVRRDSPSTSRPERTRSVALLLMVAPDHSASSRVARVRFASPALIPTAATSSLPARSRSGRAAPLAMSESQAVQSSRSIVRTASLTPV